MRPWVIEAVRGLCAPLVDGRVVPEHVELARDGSVRRRRPARQAFAARFDPVRRAVVEEETAEPPHLDTERLDAVRVSVLRAAQVLGTPVDIEWSWHPATGLTILQARPITGRRSALGP
ncbi:PEP/pyruvate-binding domain-containing protein [Thermobispora bispora]|uniref:PEP/pyruvate-binding domain-containing protein n=1 Tax=Thermobispora bispora TaxID=2006 RepID=UPI001305190B|nr:PEP/pyruvate-binding domain-containing protein [Thermobispora bispora]MBX6166158.1 hypothetical protein [Thermobispora bispora]MDI9579512.1 PEP/pyruvate-binding domain-containing protein [Thermobispora sp.]